MRRLVAHRGWGGRRPRRQVQHPVEERAAPRGRANRRREGLRRVVGHGDEPGTPPGFEDRGRFVEGREQSQVEPARRVRGQAMAERDP